MIHTGLHHGVPQAGRDLKTRNIKIYYLSSTAMIYSTILGIKKLKKYIMSVEPGHRYSNEAGTYLETTVVTYAVAVDGTSAVAADGTYAVNPCVT